jgi:peptidoglycan hydrolase-like protein with peptidoglycan-binding domain
MVYGYENICNGGIVMKRLIAAALAVVVILLWFVPALAENPVSSATGAAPTITPNNAELRLTTADWSEYTLAELIAIRADIQAAINVIAPYTQLNPGDKSDTVPALKQRLRDLYYLSSSGANTTYNSAAQDAVKDFQQANGLDADGVATLETQVILFSDAALAKPTATPKPTRTPKPTATPNPYAKFKTIDYEEISRYPERHEGDPIKFDGKVVQVLGDRASGYELRVATKGSHSDVVYLFVSSDPGFGILEDDKIRVYGYVDEPVTYTTVLGASVTIPGILCESLALR